MNLIKAATKRSNTIFLIFENTSIRNKAKHKSLACLVPIEVNGENFVERKFD